MSSRQDDVSPIHASGVTPAVGRSVRRQDGEEKVTGQARFLDDLPFRGLLYAAIHRSTRPHARVLRVDTRAARAIEGVWDVVTGDRADFRIGGVIRDHQVLARDRVRFVGEPVAVVLADDAATARHGADAVGVLYEDLAAAVTVEQALADDAPVLHPALADYEVLPGYHPEPGSNVYHRYHTEKGDADAALAGAAQVFEGCYTFPHIAHVQLEPHGAVAQWRSPTEVTIWCTSQSPHQVREVVAGMYDLPLNGVQVVVPYLGGGFGGKSDTTVEPLAAAAARRVMGRPVKLVLGREEMFAGSVLGRGCRSRIRTGHDGEGRLLAAIIELAFTCGAYGEYGINVVEGAGHVATGPYRVENLRIDSLAVYTNTPFIGAFRGYGHPEVHWGMERHLDRVAEQLGRDPSALRRANLLAPGDTHPTGQRVEQDHGDLRGCFDAVAERLVDVDRTPSAPGRVRGVALSPLMKAPVMATNASSAAILKLNGDGSVDLAVSGTEMGQGAWTALAQIAADALGMPVERIRTARVIDTCTSPYEWQTVGSTTTWKVGQAVRAAAGDLLGRLRANAAVALGAPADRIAHDGEALWDREAPERRVPIARVALNAVHPDGRAEGGPAAGYGTFTPHGLTRPDDRGKGTLAAEWTFGCHGAAVEVDTGTGEVRVLKLVTALDVGTVVNPILARGQVLGAVAQGIGAALMERIVYGKDGQIRNAGLTDYKIPTPEDLADTELEVVFLDTPFADGPFGARCIGEHGLVSVAPAIANAVRDATGCHLDDLPLDAQSVRAALDGRLADRGPHKRMAPPPPRRPAPAYRYLRPDDLDEACAALAEDPGAVALAGGTDLLVEMRARSVEPTLVVDLKRLAPLRGVRRDDGALWIGALTTVTEVLDAPQLEGGLACLLDAARAFACAEIRHRATVGGNLANASPGAEFCVPLVALEARVHLHGVEGSERSLPIGEFLRGVNHTALEPGELITGVSVPTNGGELRSAYRRRSRTRGMDLASVSLAVAIRDADRPSLRRVSLSMGAVEAVPPRPDAAEALLSRRRLDLATVAEAGRALVAGAAPRRGSLRAEPAYKRAVLPVLLERMLLDLGVVEDAE